MGGDLAFAYSADGEAIFVSEALEQDLRGLTDEAAIDAALQSHLAQRGIATGVFRMTHPLRCPNCRQRVAPRSANWQQDRVIFLGGMTYYTDDAAFTVKVDVS